jgi:5-methylcytosine-specific restriction endonuclease McrA
MNVPSKVCTKCGVEKLPEDFRPRRDRNGALLSYCRVCEKNLLAAYRLSRRVVRPPKVRRPPDPVRMKELRQKYYRTKMAKDGDRIRAMARLRRTPEKVKRWDATSKAKYPFRYRILHSNKRAQKHGVPGTLRESHFDSMWTAQGGRCFYCGEPLATGYHTDHKTPMSRGGANEPGNVCLACASCNSSKGRLTADEFLRTLRRA